MSKKRKDSLAKGIISMLIITIAVIVSMGIFIDSQNSKEVSRISAIYTAGTAEKISQYFSKVIELHLDQVQSMVNDTNDFEFYIDKDDLMHDAEIFNFDYLGLYFEDGDFEMLKGEPIDLVEPGLFMNSMHDTGRKAAMATSSEGDNVVALGIAASYKLDGRQSLALVAGYDADYFIDELSLNAKNMLVTSTIIRHDGSYVLRNTGEYKGNYFDRIKKVFDDAGADPEKFLAGLQSSIDTEEDYSGSVRIKGNEEYYYCTKIPDSEWFLVCYLPYGVINETVDNLSAQNKFAEIFALFCVIIAFIILQVLYNRTSRQQFAQLEQAHSETLKAQNELKRLLKLNEELSITDYLTHLPNRRALDRYVEEHWQHWSDDHTEVSFLTLDVDNLKYINDTFGHKEGDWVISTFGGAVSEITSKYGITARTGGDEFQSILMVDAHTAHVIEDAIYAKLDAINKESGKPYELHASIGYYETPIDESISYDECVKHSDEEMYKVKDVHRRMYNYRK